MSAVMSACGTYRYRLERALPHPWHRPPLVFVMLNPSTADASADDPTIRRCIVFARRERAASLIVVNLYALRSTDPCVLKHHANPVGPENHFWLHRAARDGIVVCAWGVNAEPQRVAGVVEILRAAGAELQCLGTTKDGHPRHPLYVRGDQPLVPWTPPTRHEPAQRLAGGEKVAVA